jgi:anti-sigma factor RsiW
MTSRADPADALAYVDACLEPEARRAFEIRLKNEPELRREVALWESQDRAIRAAFGAPARSPVELGGVSNENGLWRGAEASWLEESGFQLDQPRAPRTLAYPEAKSRRAGPGPILRRCIGLAVIAAAALAVGPPGRGPEPSPGLIAAGTAAARALADLPPEFGAADPATLAAQLGPRLALAPPQAVGLQWVGARLAPGSQSTATLYLYEDPRGARVALLVEPLDEVAAAPPRRLESDGLSLAAWTGAGYGFVAVAAEEADVVALTRAAGVDANP